MSLIMTLSPIRTCVKPVVRRSVTVSCASRPSFTNLQPKSVVAKTAGPRVGRATRPDWDVTLSLDGSGRCTTNTGNEAIDDMLRAVATRAQFDVQVERSFDVHARNTGKGDHVDHLRIEHASAAVGLALGIALRDASGHDGAYGARGLRGGGSLASVHDNAFVLVGVELANRGHFAIHDARLVDANNVITTPAFFLIDAMVRESKLQVHIMIVSGSNDDVEAATLKGFAAALHDATLES